jgi:spermidine synthase
VDNGPGYLVHESNGSLYEADFVRRCRDLLNPGGVLAVWSAAPAPALEETLRAVFADVGHRSRPVTLGAREEQYHLYLGRVASAP